MPRIPCEYWLLQGDCSLLLYFLFLFTIFTITIYRILVELEVTALAIGGS